MEEHYAQSIKILHWVMGAAMLTCMGTVKLSQWTTADTWWNGYVSTKGTKGATKGALMMIHKSTAVLVAAMIVPRVLLRMVTKAPTPLEGPALEHFAANVSHTALYGFMLAMPATGIAMGYYGGKGVPFYGLYTFPGKGSPGMPAKEKEDGKFAGTMFKWHTWMGQYIFYLLPVHVGAVGLHTFKGQPILSRVNPFASPK